MHRTLRAAAGLGVVLAGIAAGPAQAAGQRQVTEFPLRASFALPNEIASAGGALWVTDSSLGAVWRVTTKGKARFIDVGDQPSGITVGPDGALWLADASDSAIVRLSLDGTPTRFPLPAGNRPSDIASGADGALWFTEIGDQRGRPDDGRRARSPSTRCRSRARSSATSSPARTVRCG